ncbi:DUF3265 domain-containing protein [Vibrio harveyi]|uniref:DUF3265 domain-containing protein n=1 Tax=Vibrio harveyi TaxID=669 RepID=A0ABN5GZ28_VIBHA|nr:DUF3265 domain-containing protein [Vibrio harveyi]
MTKHLRVIRHAWHFWLELSSMITVPKWSSVVAWLTP